MHTIAVIGAGRSARRCSSGLLRSGWPADRLVATERRPERAAGAGRALRHPDASTTTRRSTAADVLAIAVKPQDAAALMAELGPLVPAGQAGRLALRRPAHLVLRQVAARGHAGGPGHDQHAGPGRRGDDRHLGRSARHRRAPGPRRGDVPAARPDHPAARVAAGRGHRAVRLRARRTSSSWSRR